MPNHFSVVAIVSNNPLTLHLQVKHKKSQLIKVLWARCSARTK